MSWEDSENKSKEHGSGIFLKLKDGDSFVGCFVGEPEGRETVWIDGKTFDYDKDDPTHKGVNPSVKFRFNFFVLDQGQNKILEVNNTLFGDIVHQRKKRIGLDGLVYELARTGSGPKDTKYHLDFERKCTDAELEAIGAAPVLDLRPKQDNDNPAAEGNADNGDSHSAEYIDELKSRLKQLPGSAVKDFLSAFSVAKIKDLAESDFAKADAFVSNLEQERDGGTDPFED